MTKRSKSRRNAPSRGVLMAVGAVVVASLVWLIVMLDRTRPSIICEELAAVPAGTPTNVIVYTDFACPACATLNNALLPYRGNPALRLTVRQYPLDTECNPPCEP